MTVIYWTLGPVVYFVIGFYVLKFSLLVQPRREVECFAAHIFFAWPFQIFILLVLGLVSIPFKILERWE